MSLFRTNYKNTTAIEKKIEMVVGEDQTVPNQSSSITEIVYRFQGGIIPTMKNVQYDPEEMPDDHMDVRRMSGFDITDAFHALQEGKQKYHEYITEVKRTAREKVQAEKAELERLRIENEQLKAQSNGNNI